MTNKEMATLFENMREIVCLTEKQRGYDAKQWRACVNLWHGVFINDSFAHVWAGVRMYVRGGGKYWPYPGEISDLMPSCPWCENDDLRNLTYHTRAQAKLDAERYERQHKLNPWK